MWMGLGLCLGPSVTVHKVQHEVGFTVLLLCSRSRLRNITRTKHSPIQWAARFVPCALLPVRFSYVLTSLFEVSAHEVNSPLPCGAAGRA